MKYATQKIGENLLCCSADSSPEIMVLLCCGDEIEAMLPDLMKNVGDCRSFVLASPLGVSWDSDYTPWPSDELPGRIMSGGGRDFYRRLTESILPECRKAYPSVTRTAIVGYSLGGLFALWAALQDDSPFDSAASVSGALWYEGFVDYARETQTIGLKHVYLSLGRKEAKTVRGAMGRVADATESLTGLFEERLGTENTLFEWNNGNHFFEVPQRIAKAVIWICKQ